MWRKIIRWWQQYFQKRTPIVQLHHVFLGIFKSLSIHNRRCILTPEQQQVAQIAAITQFFPQWHFCLEMMQTTRAKPSNDMPCLQKVCTWCFDSESWHLHQEQHSNAQLNHCANTKPLMKNDGKRRTHGQHCPITYNGVAVGGREEKWWWNASTNFVAALNILRTSHIQTYRHTYTMYCNNVFIVVIRRHSTVGR